MNNKRKLLLALSGASTTTFWSKPVVNTVLLPAHAEMTSEPEPPFAAPEPPFDLYDTGQGGGIVFYITDGGLHGLEAAPSDQSNGSPWGCTGTDITGATGTAIGTGSANTDAILAAGCNSGGEAANVASGYQGGGFSDWFLPSKDELDRMYTVLHLADPDPKGGFNSGSHYWSSSQISASGSWNQGFLSGGQLDSSKNFNLRVHPVRAF